MFVEIIGEKI